MPSTVLQNDSGKFVVEPGISRGLTKGTDQLGAAVSHAPCAKPPGAAEKNPDALILVVEDDSRGARLISATLQAVGYRVTIANSAAEAQRSVEREVPSLILCDVCLPEMDGIEFTQWLRGRAAGTNIPLALITSSDDTTILARGLAVGADDFLTKPVNSLELRTRVRSLLRTKNLVDELSARETASRPFDTARAHRLVAEGDESRDLAPRNVVIVEDNLQERRLLEAHLADLRCTIRGANSAAEGLALIDQAVPDLIILDLLLPDRDGYDLIDLIKKNPALAHVPILVVSALSEVHDRVKALELGADDFIVKGFERIELDARVRRLLRLKKSLDKMSHRCDRAMHLAVTDSLTGLFTRGFMHETLKRQIGIANRYGEPFSVIFGDIDHFKQINDRHGHAAGDAVLQAVAKALSEVVRQADTVVRYGGEEFVAVLPRTGPDEAIVLAERIRVKIATLEVAVAPTGIVPVTMSLGMASYPGDAADEDQLVEHGDAAMYRAKQLGRNRVIAYQACSATS